MVALRSILLQTGKPLTPHDQYIMYDIFSVSTRPLQVKVPMLIMPSHDEPDLTPLKEVMEKKEFGSKCIFHRFDDMHHGFCAAR